MDVALGNIFYWFGCGLSVVIVGIGAVMVVAGNSLGLGLFAVVILIAALIWSMGYTCRNVLSGH